MMGDRRTSWAPRRPPGDAGRQHAIKSTDIGRSLVGFLARREVWATLSIIALALVAWAVYRKLPEVQLFGLDTYAYWSIDTASPYGQAVGGADAFLYAPPFVPLFGLAKTLPWPVFRVLWLAVELGALIWLTREWTLVALAFPPVFNELFFGNINLLIPVAIVVGFRWPATWAFMLLTKVTPGIGLVWFAVRREWRAVATALGATGAIVAVSFLLAPGLWREWFSVLATSDSMVSPSSYRIPLLPRLVVAAGVIGWGGLTNRRWVVPIGVTLALPVIWSAGLSILVAVVPLVRDDRTAWRRADSVKTLV
jgi:Glycosyltransferase family 87